MNVVGVRNGDDLVEINDHPRQQLSGELFERAIMLVDHLWVKNGEGLLEKVGNGHAVHELFGVDCLLYLGEEVEEDGKQLPLILDDEMEVLVEDATVVGLNVFDEVLKHDWMLTLQKGIIAV